VEDTLLSLKQQKPMEAELIAKGREITAESEMQSH
jgi:hypothetical protein